MENIEKAKQLSKLFKESAETLDELIEIIEKETNTEENTNKVEELTGRFLIKMMQINELQK